MSEEGSSSRKRPYEYAPAADVRPRKINVHAGKRTVDRMMNTPFLSPAEAEDYLASLQPVQVSPQQQHEQDKWHFLASAGRAPQHKRLLKGLSFIIEDFIFIFKNFKADAHFYGQIKAAADTVPKTGQLEDGLLAKDMRAGFATLSKMTRAYLHARGPTLASMSDEALQIQLVVVTLSTLACHIGDVTVAAGQPDDACLLLSDIKIKVPAPFKANHDLSKVTTFVEPRAPEGLKLRGTEWVVPVAFLPTHPHACMLSLLLELASRRGVVAPGGKESVLMAASNTADGFVQWCRDEPVFQQKDGKAARRQHFVTGLKDMINVSGVQTEPTFHAFRRGATRDVKHLPQSTLDAGGFTKAQTRQVLFHRHTPEFLGTTEGYGGSPTLPIMPLRAMHCDIDLLRLPFESAKISAQLQVEPDLTALPEELSGKDTDDLESLFDD
ncbi:hypothetical protein BCR37DRAFT_408342 [Protomyces lactucae-debilis]|uniref:Uncharacterized protein n=1 Tax=Protomyces lactucae-debilis TaxID=2754530 RepID=A0A1Y2FIK6_PROLT|nr:uncharacterized protein BCR37DRAFT_408342 [Protomyces lactucae-debilis]ORY83802.1 hypothetical protein BCR37DRAFT_408342 [Protomyces lactucae-debilis]